MSKLMRAAVFYGADGFKLEDHPIPVPSAGQILYKVRATTICGADINTYNRWKGGAVLQKGMIFGHEVAGEIVEDSTGVFKTGDVAAISPNKGCGYCWFCRHELPNVCEKRDTHTTSTGGGYAEYGLAYPDQIYIPEKQLLPEELALSEPLACCIHSYKLTSYKPGDKVLIIGAGGCAQFFIQLAKIYGALSVTVADSIKTRLDLAIKMGADRVINTNNEEIDTHDSDTEGYDLVIITRSSPEFFEKAFSYSNWFGRVLIYGVAKPGIFSKYEPYLLHKKQLSLHISRSFGGNSYETAVNFLASGRISAKGLVTRIIGIDDIPTAIENNNGQIKTAIKPC